MMNDLLKKIIQNRWVQHLLLWMLSFYILLRISAYEFPPDEVDYVYTLLFHLSIWCGVYANLLLLIPFLLRRGYYLVYFLAFSTTALIMVLINVWTFKVLSHWLFPDYYFISYYQFGDLIQFSLVYLIITSLIKLSKGWFELNKKDRQIRELEKQKIQVELQALKHQLDPHFLFNSLNAIYSMSLEEDPGAAEAILQLSDNMRYVLYRANTDEIELAAELDFIRNYIQLIKARLGEEKADIQFKIEDTVDKKLKVAPLLFLPFIENAFKHGLKSDHERAFIHIFFKQQDHQLIFELQNSRKSGFPTSSEGGIGIPVARKRLEVLYPGTHQLKIQSTERDFSVYLSLNILKDTG
jgi:sensor histidine kinase YesM